MVILDTNIIVDYIRQPREKKTVLDKLFDKYADNSDTLAISIITVQELFEGKSTANKKNELFLQKLLARFEILPYTYDVAVLAGKMARDMHTPTEFADLAIAATSVCANSPLVTLNTKHFKFLPDVKLFDYINLN